MKFSENSGQAADYLRQAVPKMVKHNIVPNPLNYTLWYSYYSQEFPKLNKELEHVLERYNTCPSDIGEALFLEHMANFNAQDGDDVESFQNAVAHLVSNLSESLDQTVQDSQEHAVALKSNIDQLKSQNQWPNNHSLLTELSASSDAICDVNAVFQQQLLHAQAEIARLKSDLESSRQEATTDQLTGLQNRRVLEAIYHQYSDNGIEGDMSVILLDIDRFKMFNDTHGHLMGDQILKVVGGLLKKESPQSVTPVRFGGEEFALICPKFSLEHAKELAEAIRVKLAKISFTNKRTNEKIPPVTASFGVALRSGGELLDDLLERADKALYSAKNNGRNQVGCSY